VLRFLENRFLFYPVRAAEGWVEPPPELGARDIELTSSDGNRLHAWWCVPEGWQPDHGAVLYSHGNAGNLSHRGEGLRRWQVLLGQAVLIYDYPGYGKSTGQPDEAGCYAAAAAAYSWLVHEAQLPPSRILLYGGSLGAAMATEVALRQPARGLVLVAAFTSFPDMAQLHFPWLPMRWLVCNRLDNLAKIGQVTVPVFIAHGTEDRLIPFQHGERLFAAARKPKQFFPMPGLDHQHTPGPDFYAALQHFLTGAISSLG